MAIDLELGQDRNAAVGHGQCSKILKSQNRYSEADKRYQEAQRLAERVGDLELQAIFLQHRGSLNYEQSRHDQAVELYQNAIRLFQQANDQVNECGTYDLLASAEMGRDQLDAAEAWYGRSQALADAIGNQFQKAVTAQNFGVLFQKRADKTEDSEVRKALLRRAVVSVEESLTIKLKRKDRVAAASSYFQLGVLHLKLCVFDQAEEYLMKSLEVGELLNLPDVWKDYDNLADVAEARGDTEAAAAWQAKRDAKLAELERLRGGGSGGALPEEAAQTILALARAVYAARTSGVELAEDAAEVLAQLAGAPEPWPAVAGFLREVAEGGMPAVPEGLPEPLPEILGSLLAALRE